jgi:hypothetical protein
MKATSKFLCIIFLFFTNLTIHNAYSGNNEKEDFMGFFEDFSLNKDFQLSRIKFPLLYIGLNEEYTERDTIYLTFEKWTFQNFHYTPSNDSFGQIYDNFEHKLRDTDERVFAWHGIGNGIKEFYYFRRINGLWYLIKVENFST